MNPPPRGTSLFCCCGEIVNGAAEVERLSGLGGLREARIFDNGGSGGGAGGNVGVKHVIILETVQRHYAGKLVVDRLALNGSGGQRERSRLVVTNPTDILTELVCYNVRFKRIVKAEGVNKQYPGEGGFSYTPIDNSTFFNNIGHILE